MWSRLENAKLIEGKFYNVTDPAGFTYFCKWDGKNFVTKQQIIIKNVNFVYEL